MLQIARMTPYVHESHTILMCVMFCIWKVESPNCGLDKSFSLVAFASIWFWFWGSKQKTNSVISMWSMKKTIIIMTTYLFITIQQKQIISKHRTCWIYFPFHFFVHIFLYYYLNRVVVRNPYWESEILIVWNNRVMKLWDIWKVRVSKFAWAYQR